MKKIVLTVFCLLLVFPMGWWALAGFEETAQMADDQKAAPLRPPVFGENIAAVAGISLKQTFFKNNAAAVPGKGIPADIILIVSRHEWVDSQEEALEKAVKAFVSSVEEQMRGPDGIQGTGDDIGHRISLVGFQDIAGFDSHKNIPSSFHTENKADSCLENAIQVFQSNPVAEKEKRSRIVIFISSDSSKLSGGALQGGAEEAVALSRVLKTTYGATVYTVGLFQGADPASAGVHTTETGGMSIDQRLQERNWLLQNISSNNGAPQDPSYYLAASDVKSLESIFTQISDLIENEVGWYGF